MHIDLTSFSFSVDYEFSSGNSNIDKKHIFDTSNCNKTIWRQYSKKGFVRLLYSINNSQTVFCFFLALKLFAALKI